MAYTLRHLTRFAIWFAVPAIAGFGLPTVVSGQPPPEVMIRFTVFSAEPVDGVGYIPKPDAPAMPLVFYPTARSPRYTYEGGNPLRFYLRANDEMTSATAAEVTIPPGVRDGLLLFTPATVPGGPRYSVRLIDDGAGRHPSGAIAIVNLSGLPLRGTVGRTEMVLKDGLNPPVKIARSAPVMLRTMFRGRFYQSYAGIVELEAGERALLILLPPYRAGSLEVQSRLLVDDGGAIQPPGR